MDNSIGVLKDGRFIVLNLFFDSTRSRSLRDNGQ